MTIKKVVEYKYLDTSGEVHESAEAACRANACIVVTDCGVHSMTAMTFVRRLVEYDGIYKTFFDAVNTLRELEQERREAHEARMAKTKRVQEEASCTKLHSHMRGSEKRLAEALEELTEAYNNLEAHHAKRDEDRLADHDEVSDELEEHVELLMTLVQDLTETTSKAQSDYQTSVERLRGKQEGAGVDSE